MLAKMVWAMSAGSRSVPLKASGPGVRSAMPKTMKARPAEPLAKQVAVLTSMSTTLAVALRVGVCAGSSLKSRTADSRSSAVAPSQMRSSASATTLGSARFRLMSQCQAGRSRLT